MTEKSKYFTTDFFGFFSDLAKNNNKEWFTKSKERYENAVQEPSLRFIRDAGPRLQKISPFLVAEAKPFGGSLSRIYRDIRFSPDKSPYKTEVGIHFWHAKATGPEEMAPGYYLHMHSGETMAHSGVWHPDAPILKKIRDRIVDEPDRWKKVIRSRVVAVEGESSVHPGPATEGLRLEPELSRQPGHEPGVPRLVHRGVRVDGPAEPLPGGSDRPPLVGPGLGVALGGRVLIIGRETIHSDSATFIPQKPNTYAGRRRTDGKRSRRGLRRIAAGAIAGVGD